MKKTARFRLGSMNPVKKEALAQVLAESGRFLNVEVCNMDADSGVSDQPMGFEDTLLGARNRASASWSADFSFGVGIESGIIPVPLTKSGYMNLTSCVLFDGKEFFTGLGPAFELPEAVVGFILEEKMELDSAIKAAGLSNNPRIGYSEGLIGLLTKNVITRMHYTKPAIHMALASLPCQ
ncbi:DUF84 family protein [Desulfococcaceae bacterium OttesenSCG-928-F15]|nr:DUF84 family protein [Desulfococcaceae bacterium OttesenSCG-928-F15]